MFAKKTTFVAVQRLIMASEKKFSFKARFVETKWERLDKTALPAIAQSKDNTYFIIGKVAEDKVLLQDPAKGNYPEVLNK